jgi:DNA-binding response OmpR family regulator
MTRILIIEDDPAIRTGLEASFRAEQMDVVSSGDGDEGCALAQKGEWDLILLDLMLPGKNGRDICAELRRAGRTVPIIMVTSRSDEIDTVLGLELGADDYVTKPFSLRELHARVRALLRRSSGVVALPDVVTIGAATVDFSRSELRRHGVPVRSSVRELEVLKFLLRHEGRVVTRDMLLNDVWGYDIFPTTRTVDNYILALRKHIEDDPSAPKHIITVHTSGYRLVR